MPDKEELKRREYLKIGVAATATATGTAVAAGGVTAAEGGDDGSGRENVLVVAGKDSKAVIYEITADDDIVPHPTEGDLVADATPGRCAEGAVDDDRHVFLCDGDLTHVALSGQAAVYQNGVRIEPDAPSE